jgi:hypothetical protein
LFTDGGGTGGTRLYIQSGGNVGIGTTTPTAELYINGDVIYTGTASQASDRRLKSNITDLTSSLDKITRLQGVSYNKVVKTGQGPSSTELGLIAQDVQAVFPEVVKETQQYALDAEGNPTDEEVNYLGVSYTQLIAPMIEAIKELSAQVTALQAEVDALKNGA